MWSMRKVGTSPNDQAADFKLVIGAEDQARVVSEEAGLQTVRRSGSRELVHRRNRRRVQQSSPAQILLRIHLHVGAGVS